MKFLNIQRLLLCSFMALLLAGCSTAPKQSGLAHEQDPWEGMNRSVYGFNKSVDEAVLSPLASAYAAITPDFIEQGIENFFNNLADVNHFVNHLLQGKPGLAANDAGRLLINTTVGVGGLFDVAANFGMYQQEEDFGQTLGYWGVESGPYLVLPFMGPSTVRDGVSLLADYQLDPVAELKPSSHQLPVQAVRVLDTRVQLQDVQRLIIGDEYSFIRDAYLSRRQIQIHDGAPIDSANGDDFDEFDEFD